MLIPHSRNVCNSSFCIFPKFIITMQRYIFFLKRPLPKLRNYLLLLQNCVRLNPEIISSFLVRISFTSPLHILPPFHNPIPPIPDGIHQRSYTPKPLIISVRIISPFQFVCQQNPPKSAPFRPHRGQILIQQIAIIHFAHVQPLSSAES